MSMQPKGLVGDDQNRINNPASICLHKSLEIAINFIFASRVNN